MFLSLLKDADGVAAPGALVRRRFPDTVTSRPWDRQVLFDTTADSLAPAACEWAGLPLGGAAVADLSRDCTAMLDGFVSPGPRHVRAHRALSRQEQALAALTTDVRATRAGTDDSYAVLVTQGGGDPAHGHRCPGEGEDITVTALAVLATELARLDFDVPQQDRWSIALSRIPALPRSGFELILRP
ncbi:hypothetical protein [Streptomyces sp. NRRL F-2580]|uniref:hypothetical protein n=1 Tax=Streptomyces sp. NRRL F-2580 TaxID=1463841 RepID=UPI0004C568DD|nr:hypothetical protein [Streptomyces sp. NRRL F-2580]